MHKVETVAGYTLRTLQTQLISPNFSGPPRAPRLAGYYRERYRAARLIAEVNASLPNYLGVDNNRQ